MSRASQRGVGAVDAAVVVAVMAAMLAATVPSCLRAIRLTRTAEASQNLDRLIQAGALHGSQAGVSGTPLSSTPLTPAIVPRGAPVDDPAGSWDHPTFRALDFSIDEPHWYAYRVDVDPDRGIPLRIVAQGDLDGDGVVSTFERTARREGAALVPNPALVVSSDLE